MHLDWDTFSLPRDSNTLEVVAAWVPLATGLVRISTYALPNHLPIELCLLAAKALTTLFLWAAPVSSPTAGEPAGGTGQAELAKFPLHFLCPAGRALAAATWLVLATDIVATASACQNTLAGNATTG